MTTYTIEREGEAQERGLTLAAAARYLMEADGYAYKFVRRRDGWLDLLISDGSRNSTRGARHFRRSVFVGKTQREAYEWAIGQEWRGYEATDGAEFDRRAAELAAEESEA